MLIVLFAVLIVVLESPPLHTFIPFTVLEFASPPSGILWAVTKTWILFFPIFASVVATLPTIPRPLRSVRFDHIATLREILAFPLITALKRLVIGHMLSRANLSTREGARRNSTGTELARFDIFLALPVIIDRGLYASPRSPSAESCSALDSRITKVARPCWNCQVNVCVPTGLFSLVFEIYYKVTYSRSSFRFSPTRRQALAEWRFEDFRKRRNQHLHYPCSSKLSLSSGNN